MRPHMKKSRLLNLAIFIASFVTLQAFAQEPSGDAPRVLTAADYARAEKFMGYNTTPLVFHNGANPNWLPDERFWYRLTTAEGSEFVMIDPLKGTRSPGFDQVKLASARSSAVGETYDVHHLPFTEFECSANGQNISFNVRGRRWKCDIQANQCS